jgi:hypothetical protein
MGLKSNFSQSSHWKTETRPGSVTRGIAETNLIGFRHLLHWGGADRSGEAFGAADGGFRSITTLRLPVSTQVCRMNAPDSSRVRGLLENLEFFFEARFAEI